MTPKNKKIIEDAEREGIPIFVFTAKDYISTSILLDYYVKCRESQCSKNHNNAILDSIDEFENWQNENPDKVKLPD